LIVAQQLLEVADPPEQIFPIVWKRNASEAFFDETVARDAVKGAPILVLDTAVHSGATMMAGLRLLESSGCAALTSFALVVRCGATVIPNFFSLLINDTDRLWLLAHTLPNQRLTPTGVYRRLIESDVSLPMIKSGADFIDRGSWSDHWYDMAVDPNRYVYVVEDQSKLVGFVTFKIHGNTIRIDEVAVDQAAQGRGWGKFLIRWAENLARHRGCRESTLWSIENRVEFYTRRDYERTDEELRLGDDGHFIRMRKRILYNIINAAS
jgi:GNAT superfamily N-acetyltransferase